MKKQSENMELYYKGILSFPTGGHFYVPVQDLTDRDLLHIYGDYQEKLSSAAYSIAHGWIGEISDVLFLEIKKRKDDGDTTL